MSTIVTGLFVVLEGPKGVGKSTVADHIRRVSGDQYLLTKEPTTDFDTGQEDRLDPLRLAEAIVADRLRHVTGEILPELRRGRVVISDRYLLSTLVFQGWDGYPRYLARARVPFGLLPHLTLLLCAEPDEITRRRVKNSRFSREIPIRDEIDAYRSLAHMATADSGDVVTIYNGRYSDPGLVAQTIVATINSLRPDINGRLP